MNTLGHSGIADIMVVIVSWVFYRQTRNHFVAAASLAAAAAAVGLLLLAPLHAQAKGASNRGRMGTMGMTMGCSGSHRAQRHDRPARGRRQAFVTWNSARLRCKAAP